MDHIMCMSSLDFRTYKRDGLHYYTIHVEYLAYIYIYIA
jgi:hypothetical protein